MNSRRAAAAVAGFALLAAGAALQPLADSLRGAAGVAEPPPAGARLDAMVGRGVSLAVLGGYRALAADLLWLETYVAWRAGDRSATAALIRMVTAVDERREWFWLNGARMIAYDMAHWRQAEAAADGNDSPARRRQIREEQAGAALDLLAEARRWHPRSAAVCMEMANIELCGRADAAAAARWYRAAAGLPGAPHCAARIFAELLRRQGRRTEAYAWLRRLHPTLRRGDPEAMPDVVLARIRELETELGIPAAARFAPPEIDLKSQRGQKKN